MVSKNKSSLAEYSNIQCSNIVGNICLCTLKSWSLWMQKDITPHKTIISMFTTSNASSLAFIYASKNSTYYKKKFLDYIFHISVPWPKYLSLNRITEIKQVHNLLTSSWNRLCTFQLHNCHMVKHERTLGSSWEVLEDKKFCTEW